MLLFRSLRKYFYYLILALFILTIASRVFEPQPLITAEQNGFLRFSEAFVPFILLVPVSFLLYDNYEIELALVCGVRTTRLMMVKFCAILLYTFIAVFAMISLYKYTVYYPFPQTVIIIPIHIPENYKLYMFISASVTILFFAALYLFLRVTSKNCYLPIGLGLFAYTVFDELSKNINSGNTDIKNCLFDPFISSYIIGNKVPVEHYQIGNVWTYNRLLFLGLAVLMLFASYLLLRREKLHHGSND